MKKQLLSKSVKIFYLSLVLLVAGISPMAAQWSIVGSAGISSSVANYTAIAIDGNNAPHIAYADNSVSNKLTVKKYSGSSWNTLGSTGVSASSVEHISMAIDGSNVYVGYRDASQSNKVTVMKHNGTSWSTVGSAGISDGSASYISLAVDGNGTIYVAYQDNTVSGKISVKKYSGSSWSYVGSKGFTNPAEFVKLKIDGNGDLYLAYRDNNTWKATVMKYTSSWSALGTSGFSSGSISGISLAIDGNNKPYVVIKDNNNSSKATVMSYNGSTWSTVGTAGFSAGQIDQPDIAIDGNDKPFVSFKDHANNQEATVMSYNGTTWSIVTAAGFSASQLEYLSLAIASDNTMYVGFRDNAVGQKATVMKHAGAASSVNTWTGNTSTSWTTAGNWSANAVPASSDNVKIPGGRSKYPNVTTGTVNCKNIEISTGATVTIDGGKLSIAGTIVNKGTFDVEDGTIELNGAAAQSIPSGAFKNNTVRVLELDNSAGAVLADTVKIVEAFKPVKGKLTTNNKLVLLSSSTRTAYIGAGVYTGDYINGNVTVERFIKGRRAFRFMAHPFNHSIALNQLMDDIDITGTGGTANGFTQVQVDAPSAFYFDVTTADNSTYGNNPGWKDFTNTTSATWDRNEMARIMFRGSKGQGLTGTAYTPANVTIDMYGTPNQGDQLVTLNKGSNSYFVISGNPFAAPVNLKNVYRYNIYSSFVVWDPYQGTRGAYVARQFSDDYILPAYAGFVTAVSSGNTGYIYFPEAAKSASIPDGVLKTTSVNHKLELHIEDSAGVSWDRLLVDFDSAGMAVQDTFDMIKLNNPDVDFYTISTDKQPLSIDVRPFEDKKVINIGFMPYMDNRFVLKAPVMDIPSGTKLYLYDKYLNTTQELHAGFEYWFDAVDADTNTYGENRFFINMVDSNISDTTTGVKAIYAKQQPRMQLIPNPAQNQVKISFDKLPGAATVVLTDATGKVVYTNNVNTTEGSVVIPLTDLPAGLYIVALKGEKINISAKLVKQQ